MLVDKVKITEDIKHIERERKEQEKVQGKAKRDAG